MLVAVSMAALLILSFGMYLYLIHKDDEEADWKSCLKIRIEYKALAVTVAAFAVSAVMLCYRCYTGEPDILRYARDSAVSIWLSVIGYIDFKEKIIPNKMILTGVVLWIVLSATEIFTQNVALAQVLVFSLLGALICGGILFVISMIWKTAIGMGDAKMFMVLGLFYGFYDTYSILLATIVVMAIASLVLLIAKKATRKTALPMAPFTAVGFLLSILAGL